MDRNFTLKQLTSFTQNEKKLLAEVGLVKNDPIQSPGDNVVQNLLNFSQSFSVRKSKCLGSFEMILN